MNEDERNYQRADEAKGAYTPEEVADLVGTTAPPAVIKVIGIGMGDTGQYLEQMSDGSWRIVDERAYTIIRLVNPGGLLRGLQRQRDLGEL